MEVKSYPPTSEFARRPSPLVDSEPPPAWVPAPPAMGAGRVCLCVLLTLGTIAAGAWAAAVAYAGPAYGFAIDTAPAWAQTTHRTELHLVPGAVAVLAGLVLLVVLPRLRRGRRRFLGGLAALVAIAAGVALVLGRAALAAYTGSQSVNAVAGSPLHVFLLRLGYEWGPGLVLVLLAAWLLGLQAVRRPTRDAT
jgi:hypothetical protein